MNTKKSNIRIISVILAALSALLIAGCKSSENPEEMYSYILNKGDFPSMTSIDPETLSDVYGIEASELESYAFYKAAASETNRADEIAIFKLSDNAYEETLIRVLKAHITSLAHQAQGYNKEQYEIILNTEVYSQNSYVFFIINKDGSSLSEDLIKSIGSGAS